MGVLKFIFSFFFLLFPKMITSEENCPDQYCPFQTGPAIQFPFRLTGRDGSNTEGCGYPGFDLTCNSVRNKTVLKLPYSEEFVVRVIDYSKPPEIALYDPEDCLPRHYIEQKLNISGSPFKFIDLSYQNYTFLNCSKEGYKNFNLTYTNMSSSYLPISCLGSSTHTVLATNFTAHNISQMNITSSCELIASVTVPIQRRWRHFGVFYPLVISDIFLTWDPPPEIMDERHELPKAAIAAIIIGGAIPGLICFIFILYIRCKFGASRPSQSVIVSTGLDESTISSYPEMVLSESKRFLSPENTTCSICLLEYRPKDTLKTLPECFHYFHADCITEWLRLNGTCPVCRNSPVHLQLHVRAIT